MRSTSDKRQRLQIVVAQHQRADLVGHRGKQAVAVSGAEASLALEARHRDLDIDLDVGRVHAGRIVDGVGVELDALLRRFDAAALGDAEIGAFADHPGADVAARDTDRIVGAVAGLIVAFPEERT